MKTITGSFRLSHFFVSSFCLSFAPHAARMRKLKKSRENAICAHTHQAPSLATTRTYRKLNRRTKSHLCCTRARARAKPSKLGWCMWPTSWLGREVDWCRSEYARACPRWGAEHDDTLTLKLVWFQKDKHSQIKLHNLHRVRTFANGFSWNVI